MPLEKNKLIFCTDGIHPELTGGMQRHSRLLIEALAKNHPLEIIVVHPHVGKKLFEDFKNITEVTIPFKPNGNYLLNCFNYSKEVFEAIKPYSNTLIYSQGLSVWSQVKKLKNRLIINPHGLEAWQGLTFRDSIISIPFKTILKHIFKNAAYVVSLGGKLSDILNGIIAKEKIAVLHNAVNIPQPVERSFVHSPLQMLYVGRFVRNKGIDILINTAEQLNEEGYKEKVVYNIAGNGPLYEQFAGMIKSPNIHLTGFADDTKLKELYTQNDAFVFPSVIEGLPTVVLEAMSYGLPVVACDTGATSELVDNSNGFLIDKNSPLQLKNAIKKFFFLNEDEWKKLSLASYKKVSERFSWTQVAKDHYELFERFW